MDICGLHPASIVSCSLHPASIVVAGDSVHSSHSKNMVYPWCLVLPIIGAKGKRALEILHQLLRLKYRDEKHHNLLARLCNWKKR